MVECRIPGHITGLYIFAVVNLCALLNISLVSADVYVISTKDNHTNTIASMEDIQAAFGPDFRDDGIIGRVVYVTPPDACSKVDPPPLGKDLPWIALISRGPCHFDRKVLNVQNANFSAAIVFNYKGHDEVTKMSGDSAGIQIPSVFVGYTDGMELALKYNYTNKKVVIKIKEYNDDGFTSYFWPFTVVVSICFLMLIFFSIFKCIRYFQYKRRTRLSTRALKKIPTRKYKKGDHYDTCAICLEDYEEGEKLRVLPCDHTYHCKCIDPWLTKRKKTCPQCKRRVIPGQETDSDSETEGEASGASENTPLLGNNNSRTFSSNGRTLTYDRRNPRRTTRHTHGAVVVDETRGETAAPASASAQQTSESDDDSDEELEGAVGGVGISDQQTSEDDTTDVVVEVEPAHQDPEEESQPADAESTAEDNTTDAAPLISGDRHSPARVEGSINMAFTSSGSGDDDGAGATGGRGKKKRKTNHVV